MASEFDEILKQIKELKAAQAKNQNVDPNTEAYKEANKELQKSLNLLKQKIKDERVANNLTEEQTKQLNGQVSSLQKVNNELSSALTLNKKIATTFGQHGKDLVKYLGHIGMWFEKGQQIATEYFSIQRNIGLSAGMQKSMTYDIQKAVPDIIRMGGKLEDIGAMYEGISDQSGRVTSLRKEELLAIEAIAKGTEIYSGDIAKMAEQMGNVGINAEKAAEYVNQIFVESQSMGLNATKVVSVLQSNMQKLSNYSFANGVKGMTQMAKQAVSMRMEVSDLLGMSENLYNPEQAIESAAELQLMGGEIAKAFGDPFETMYLARNKPEELAKRVQDMTTNMLQFNEQSGEFELPPEARQQLNFAAEKLGLSKDNMIEMARQSGKLREIKMNLGGNAFEEETLQGLAGLAKFRDGKWVVDHKGTEIELGDASKIEDAMADGLLDAPKTEKDALLTIAQNTMNLDEMTSAIRESIEFKAATETGIYEKSMEVLKPGIDHFEKKAEQSLDLVLESIEKGAGGIAGMIERSLGSPDSGDNVITKAVDKTFGTFNKAIEEQMMEGGINPETMVIKAATKVIVNGSIDDREDVMINGGNDTIVSGPAGTFKLHKEDQYVTGAGGSLLAGTDLFGDSMNKVSTTTGNNTTLNVNGTIDVRGPQGTIAQFSRDEVKKLVMQVMAGDVASGGKTSNKSAQYQST